VLDLGAGTGAASRALAAEGARVVAVDVALGMLLVDRTARPPAAVADALALPFGNATVDGVVAAFSLNHLDDPVAGLLELVRVGRSGSPILASAYAADDTHPVKAAVDAAAAELGWREDAWRLDLRARAEPLLSSVERATAVTRAAGLDARVEVQRIELPELSPIDLVEWRLGMAHVAPFVLGLDPAARAGLVDRAVALMGDAPSLVRSIVWISALVP
jgi:SAM-dependent methyltransferase